MSEKSHNKLVNVPMVSMCDLLFRRNASMVHPPQKKHAHTQQTSFFAMDIADTLCHAPKIFVFLFWKIISRPIFRQRALSSATQTLGLMQFCVSVVGRRVPLCRFRIQIQRRWIDRELLYRIHLVTMRLFFFRARARSNKMFIFPFER